MNPGHPPRRTVGCLLTLLLLGAPAASPAADEVPGPAAGAFFTMRIQPVLEQHCYECHSARAPKLRGGLRLDSRDGMRSGGDNGPAVVPGNVAGSPIVAALKHEGLAMPPKRRLPDAIIADFEAWIKMGAPDPRTAAQAATTPEPDYSAARQFWAFRPVQPVTPPPVRDTTWAHSPIDRFILSSLEQKGLAPAPVASKRELIRRLSFDLHGLPPAPEEVEAFVTDAAPDAYERLVDRLLANPHYGERWGQHWLDVVRYAETEGFEYDRTIPGAWNYRDYVVRSFNQDKPFDRFVREQLAGDESDAADAEARIAAGFHRLGPVRRNAGNQDVASSRNEVLTERTDILGTAFLGLTIGCARCHDHKFDPIPQKDYYRLQAYVAATQEHDLVLANTTIASIQNVSEKRTPIHVLKRGDWDKPGVAVSPRPLGVLSPEGSAELSPDTSKPRTELARWLTAPRNPLTPRVFVNRVWQYHFGRGLVRTANDFGQNGARPSHPELLDYLTGYFLKHGWHVKPLHRLILLSSTYRQSSHSSLKEHSRTLDPDNALLWHFPRRRLASEELRDTMLAVSGRLNRRLGGPSVLVPVDQELVNQLYDPKQWQVTADRREHDRRSLYLLAKRNLQLPFMEVFDQPPALTSCSCREQSTHAPQALEMLNGRLANELAEAFAQRLQREAGTDVDCQIERAYLLAAGRRPTNEERRLSHDFLATQPLREFALAMFNLNAFLYVP